MCEHVDILFRTESQKHEEEASAQHTADGELARRESVSEQGQPLCGEQSESAHDHAGSTEPEMVPWVQDEAGKVRRDAREKRPEHPNSRSIRTHHQTQQEQ